MNLRAFVRLVRPKHYLKNFLIFLPLVFSGHLTDRGFLERSIYSFIAFSLAASAVYIFNDINDRKLDTLHPKKKFRPIASGEVSLPVAGVLAILLLAGAGVFQYFADVSFASVGLLALYILINVCYSLGLKNIPIVDVAILALGFVLRVLYGGASTGIDVSKWLYLAVLASSFYLGLGKRRNEIRSHGATTRKVNQYYTQEFLDKNMYVCLGLTIVYYSLWAIDPAQPHKYMYLTIPIVLIMSMAYSHAVERADSDGDPVSVILGNKVLMGLAAVSALTIMGLLYA